MFCRLIILLCLTYGFVKAEVDDRDVYLTDSERKLPDVCYPDIPKGRVPWILYHRQLDYGWKEHTHRANIALAVNFYQANKTEMDMMELQLEVEIANALLGNKEIYDNDLALFIHALIAKSKNPRSFHGKDLVADLLDRVNRKVDNDAVHPFLVLVLCNSKAVEFKHLTNLRENNFTAHRRFESIEQMELKALALKAYACAANFGGEFDKFGDQMKSAHKCLTGKQAQDGSIGNAYTTALAVQALIASPLNPSWNRDRAIRYLEKQSEIRVNMIKAYYIELALNAQNVKFIGDLYAGPPMVPDGPRTAKHFIRYTIRADVRPHIYHTITIQFEETWSFFDLMKRCVQEGPVFEFGHYLNQQDLPMIFSVSGIPNDAEENMFWRICLQKSTRANPLAKWETLKISPQELTTLNENDHLYFWYRSTDCA